MQKLTKRAVDALRPQLGRDIFHWCGELRGFGVRVKPSGVRTFLIQYRTKRGQTRRYSLGQYGRVTVEEARREAKIKLADVARGEDPSEARKVARGARTVAELCDHYLQDAWAGRTLHRGRPKKSSTLQIDEGRVRRHIKPLLGGKAIDEVTRRDVERFLHHVAEGATSADVKTGPRGRARIRGGPGTAAKAVSLLSAVYNYALRKQWVGANPCVGVEKPADNRRQRYLTADEYGKLGRGLFQAERLGMNTNVLIAIVILAFTGCRKGEILNLKRDEIDADGHCLRLRDSKSGPQLRPCGRAALNVLAKLPLDGSDWVFPAGRGDGPLVNIRKPLVTICKIAGLADVTPHVLRHSYATVAHELGYSELTIAGLLGHRAGSITARYAHHVDSALAAAADQVSATIAARLRGSLKPAADIELTSGPLREAADNSR
ncbi:MAG: tyrosine-type recombinase/integrase [Methyloceanibacter sp.]